MLMILILLLTFTDFDLSGQNIKTDAMFLQNLRNCIFDAYLISKICERTKNPFTMKILPQDK